MSLIDVLLVILILIASVLGLYLIKLVKRFFITIEMVEAKVQEIDDKITPLLSDVQKMADTGSSIAKIANDNIEDFKSVLSKVKGRLTAFIPSKMDDRNASPQTKALNFVTNLRAISKGVSAFINELKK